MSERFILVNDLTQGETGVIMHPMGFLRKFFIELIVVGVIVGWAVAKFRRGSDSLGAVALFRCVLALAWEVLPKQRIKDSSLTYREGDLRSVSLPLSSLLCYFRFSVVWGLALQPVKLEIAEGAQREKAAL